LSSLRRDLTAAQAELKQTQLDAQTKEQQLVVDREGMKWQVDRLQRELEKSQAAYRKLSEEREAQMAVLSKPTVSREQYDQTQADLNAAKEQLEKVTTELRQREQLFTQIKQEVDERDKELERSRDALKQAKELLKATSGASTASPPATGTTASAATAGGTAEMKVYRTNDVHGFVVVSLEGTSGFQQGDQLIFSVNGVPAAEVELGEVDATNMAVAYIKRKLNAKVTIRKGDTVQVRRLAKLEKLDEFTSAPP